MSSCEPSNRHSSKTPITATSLQNAAQTDSEASSSSSFSSQNEPPMATTGYLDASNAFALDQDLFAMGYTLEQLMELAGLSVAEAVYASLPPKSTTTKRRILIVCGPGNNGGDGLVAARHLLLFGYDVTVVYPKRSTREAHYERLVKQCEDMGVEVRDDVPSPSYSFYDGIVDAMFGFSFKGEPREPFASAIQSMMRAQSNADGGVDGGKRPLVISVDVPSGWNVNEGDVHHLGFRPDVLVSLTAPKLCSKKFQGRHFVGGRFLPPSLAEKYNIRMPPYHGVSQVMEMVEQKKDDDNWAEQYAAYCAEKESAERTGTPSKKETETPSQNNDNAEDDWAVHYHNHLVEKEAELNSKEIEISEDSKPS